MGLKRGMGAQAPIRGTVETMRAAIRSFASKNSRAKKAIAIIASAALVASVSNFQAFAATASTEDAAANPKVAVIDFEIADGMKVVYDGKNVKNGASLEVSTQRDVTFTVKACGGDVPLKIGKVAYTTSSLSEKQSNESAQSGQDGETGQGNASVAATQQTDEGGSQDEGLEVSANDPAVAATDELTKEHQEDEGTGLSQSATLADTGNSQEEAIADDLTPQAYPQSADQGAEPAAQVSSEDEAVEVETTFVNGRYVVPADALMAAAKSQKKIVVKITSSEINAKEEAANWTELKSLLESTNAETAITLTGDIEVELGESELGVKVEGDKAIQLAGHHITVKDPSSNAVAFEVADGASLSIDDTATAGIEAVGVESTETTNSEKYAKSDIAQLATYENKTLTYYVTHSETDRLTGTTKEIRDKLQLNLAGEKTPGSLEAEGMNALIKVDSNASLSIGGGLFTNAEGNHAITAKGAKSVTIDGGFIVGSGAKENGGGIYFEGVTKEQSTLSVGDSAYIAGNVSGQKHNGGGIWATNCTLIVDGDAVIAGNKASRGDASDTVIASSRVEYPNGGGIYVEANSDVRIAGNAIIAGNRAAADGGGVYVKATLKKNGAIESTVCSNSLVLDESCCITNNQSDHNYESEHPSESPEPRPWNNYGGGGGGIFTGANTTINNAEITANYASDTGGGLYLPGEFKFVMPKIAIEYAVIAGNACGTSEGGGLTVMPAAESYLRMGYITNNSTATDFDYGGGGLFVPSGGTFEVRNPVVKGNTADGYGGGVAACTNGTVITSDAAIFDNTANHEGYTTNPNEYGDQWASMNRLNLPKHSSDDYFCAKASTVYNNMLGGGVYNWDGYMSGKASNRVEFKKVGWFNAANKVVVSDPMGKVLETYSFGNANFEKGYAYVYLPETMTLNEVSEVFVGTTAVFTGTGYDSSEEYSSRAGLITSVRDSDDEHKGYHKYLLNLNFDITKPTKDGGAVYKDDSDTVVADGVVEYFKTFVDDTDKEGSSYHVYKILSNKFPEDGHAVASRFMALKAHPYLGDNNEMGQAAAKAAAMKEASVFITGNYSANNGGGIGCNGKITIGKNPKEDNPDDPKLPPDTFNLTIDKSWTNLKDMGSANNGTITTAFRVRAYQSKAAYTAAPNNPKFETVIGMTFDEESGASMSRTIEDIKKGWYVVVEEIGFAGDNFTVDSAEEAVSIKGDETVKFENTFNDDKSYGTGVVNSYAQGESGDFNSNGIQVSQDTVYKNRRAAAEAQGGLTNLTDPVIARVAGE
ncbi:hypothetical protein VIN30_01725 [Adlercreutzia sp. R7]|uniref:Right handed beta helix domain-containing protein n=1 Tax=Adlercreutzia wanghongyangiae TaxID=3111451 RepID=A0ABU6IFE5_9ACTN|nr:hypothetical protein [Adlercreutzia sp. R7]